MRREREREIQTLILFFSFSIVLRALTWVSVFKSSQWELDPFSEPIQYVLKFLTIFTSLHLVSNWTLFSCFLRCISPMSLQFELLLANQNLSPICYSYISIFNLGVCYYPSLDKKIIILPNFHGTLFKPWTILVGRQETHPYYCISTQNFPCSPSNSFLPYGLFLSLSLWLPWTPFSYMSFLFHRPVVDQ